MAIMNEELFSSEAFTNELHRIIREGDMESLTTTNVLNSLEDKFELDRDSLKEQPWKKKLKAMIKEHIDNAEENTDEPNANMSAAELDEDGNSKEEQVDTSVDEDVETKYDSANNGVEDDSSSDLAPPQKKKRPEKAQTAKQKSTGNKTTQDDRHIQKLKSYVFKCGVQKSWKKELADCHTKKSQVLKIKQILEDLGVEGRPTLEKCKAVKKDLALKNEIADLDTENILELADEGPSLRSTVLSRKRRRLPIVQDDSESEEDASLDVSFLGQQSESD